MDAGTEKNADILISGGLILAMDEVGTCIENGFLAISGDHIAGLGTNPELSGWQAREHIDAQGKLIIPGLINTHTHLPMSLFRGMADDLPLEQWLQEHMFPAEAKFIIPENVRAAVQLSVSEMLLSGTTTCCDGYFLAHHVADTVARTGLRAVLGQGVIDFPAPGVPDSRDNIRVAEDFVRQWLDRQGMISPSIFCHSLYTCSEQTLRAAKRTADELGVLFQIHVSETRLEAKQCRQNHGCSPLQYLEKLGLLDQQTLLVHAVWVDDADIEIISKTRAGVVHCPESNMKLGSGIAPIPRMLSEGVPVGLGTDGCASNNDFDLFGEMDMAAKLHKAHQLDPIVMDAQTVLRMATIDGARILGLENEIGSLEAGKQADLLMIDLAKPHLTPIYNPVSHLVYAAKGADVNDVMIAGQWVVRNRRLLTMDVEAVMDEVKEIMSA